MKADYIPHLREYLRQEVRLVFDEGKESGYDGKNTGENERISCLIVYNHLQQLHALIYGKFLQELKKSLNDKIHLKSLTAAP